MTRSFGAGAAILGFVCTGAAVGAQNPVTISSTKLQSNFNGAIGAGQSAPIAASAFDFSGQATLDSIDSVSITITVIDGDTGFGPNGVSDTPFPPDGGVYGDDDFDVNSLGLHLDGVDLGQNLLLNTLDSFEEPFGPEDYITRTISGSPANKAALLSALQDGLLVATIYDSTGISQSNGLRIPSADFSGNQQIFVTLTITGTDSITPVPTEVVSRKTHAMRGEFDIVLPLTGNIGVECRSAGANSSYEVIFAFAGAITFADAFVQPAAGKTAELDGSPTQSSDGRRVAVRLRNVSNAQRLGLTLVEVNDGQSTGDVTVQMGVLLGDTNSDGSVNSGDAQQTRNRSGQTTDGTNFRSDVNTDGTVNSGDAFIVRGRSGNAIP